MRTTFGRCAAGLLVSAWAGSALAQNLDFERARGRTMLHEIQKDIQKLYYDPAFHGVDVPARFKAAEDKLATAESLAQVFGIVGQAVLDLNDSHTRFFPPQRSRRYDYGWQMSLVGEDCYVTSVRPGSDAEARGLKPGDKLLAIAGFGVKRQTLWKLRYLLYSVRPLAGLRVLAQSPGEAPREIDIRARVSADRRVLDMSSPEGFDFWDLVRAAEREAREDAHHYFELGDDALVWKMPDFDLTGAGVDEVVGKAAKRKALVIDMRGNTGGAIDILERLVWRTFPKDVTVGAVKERTGSRPWLVRSKGHPFGGTLVALVDSDSASCSEIYARLLQLEKRGTVLGDRTAGAVMRSRFREYQIGADQVLFYHASITVAAVVMRDGGVLEGSGVTPDETMLPGPEDLASGRDPVLARALKLAGVEVSAEQAGKMFPLQWSEQ